MNSNEASWRIDFFNPFHAKRLKMVTHTHLRSFLAFAARHLKCV